MLQRQSVLVVDDDPSMLRLLTRVVQKFVPHADVSSVSRPDEAAVLIDHHNPDVVITDLDMPGIDGIEILRAAKRKNPLVQVLVLTGHSSVSQLLAAMENGASDYLLKPVEQEQLAAFLQQAFERVFRWRQSLLGTLRETSRTRHPATDAGYLCS